MDNFDDNNNFNQSNNNYLREIEKNSTIFEKKIKRLNNFKYPKKIKNDISERNDNLNNISKFNQNDNMNESYYNNQIDNYSNIENDLYDNNNNNNNNNTYDLKIEQLENEISYKDTLIKELREQLNQKMMI